MRILDSSMTKKQAAKQFAATAFDEPREIGTWLINPFRFQLEHGRKWYRVEFLSDFTGLEIVEDHTL